MQVSNLQFPPSYPGIRAIPGLISKRRRTQEDENLYKLHKIVSPFSVSRLINVAYYRLPRDYSNPGESHDFWELVYVDKGEIVVRAGTTNYLLKAGELAFHCPNEYHNVLIYNEKPANIIVIAFCCGSPYMKAFEHKILLLGQQEKQCLSTIVKEAEASYLHFDCEAPYVNLIKRDDASFGSDQIIKTSLEQLFIHIYRHNENIRFEARSLPSNHLHHHAALAAQAEKYLQEHYSEKITLDSLAVALGVSTSQLKRVFREQTDSSVIAYLTNLRIGEAKRMIRDCNCNFTQIAEAVGYDNIYYFSTQFKKHTGMTPTEYSRSVRR